MSVDAQAPLPATMLAMLTKGDGQALQPAQRPLPVLGAQELRVQVLACGVCRTDLHIIDGELAPHRHPVVPGHEVVGRVVERGAQAQRFALGQRVGIPWLGGSCHVCGYCLDRRENLCDRPVFTGYDRDGGFAEYCVADERFCFALPEGYDDAHAAPLLCAGLIGFRAWRMAGAPAERPRLGLYGFGAAAHLIAQIAQAQGQQVFAFTRPGDAPAQDFARRLGAVWAGGSDEAPPQPLDAALIFAPAGDLVPTALRAVRKGGVVVCAGIHMSPIPGFDYGLLWGERVLCSVANLTRADGEAYFELLQRLPPHARVQTHVQTFALREANQAVQALRHGQVQGAAVLLP